MKKYTVTISPGLEHHRKNFQVRKNMNPILALPQWIFECVEGFAFNQGEFDLPGVALGKDILHILQIQQGRNPQTFVRANRMTFFLDFLGHADRLAGYSLQAAYIWPGPNSNPFSFTLFFDSSGKYKSVSRD